MDWQDTFDALWSLLALAVLTGWLGYQWRRNP